MAVGGYRSSPTDFLLPHLTSSPCLCSRALGDEPSWQARCGFTITEWTHSVHASFSWMLFLLSFSHGGGGKPLNPTSPIRCMKYVESTCWFAARKVWLKRALPQEAPYHLVMQLCLTGRTWPPLPPPSMDTQHAVKLCPQPYRLGLCWGRPVWIRVLWNIPACIVPSLRSTVRLFSPGLRPMEQHAAWKAII